MDEVDGDVDWQGGLAYSAPPGMLDFFCSIHPGISVEQAAVIFVELKKYLVLVGLQRKRDWRACCSPPRDIDQMWHVFIYYDTTCYWLYCHRFLCAYIGHSSSFHGNFVPQYANSTILNLAVEYGIMLDTEIWSHPVEEPDRADRS